MIYAEPDFYGDFKCIADKCRHSCCIGWEIDIDVDTAEYYGEIDGEIGEKLKRCISEENEPHFILTDNERCPFLKDNGLCELILTMGEDSLCDICTEHPRFYNCLDNAEERGLGLCCEEAVRLLLASDDALRIVYTVEEDDELPNIIMQREEIFKFLSDREYTLMSRMKKACAFLGTELPEFEREHWRKFLLSLERLDAQWTDTLNNGLNNTEPEGAAFERLAMYMVYRHFTAAENPEETKWMLQFAFLSVRLIAALSGDKAENIRMYSSEIEYSDENIALIVKELKRLSAKD